MLIAFYLIYIPSKLHTRNISFILPITLLGHALDRLVSVSSIHYCTSTSDLSTSSSSRGLTTYVGISHLEGGFTLRCLQRLSRPGLATLPCTWYATDMDAMARQPEKMGDLRSSMIIAAALVEGVAFFAVIIAILAIVM